MIEEASRTSQIIDIRGALEGVLVPRLSMNGLTRVRDYPGSVFARIIWSAIGTLQAIVRGMNDLLHTLLGAALVAIGVLAAALADRIRQLRSSVSSKEGLMRREPRAKAVPVSAVADSDDVDSGEVVAALVAAGYKKAAASRAASACTAREQSTPESWVAAALRRCAQGGAS